MVSGGKLTVAHIGAGTMSQTQKIAFITGAVPRPRDGSSRKWQPLGQTELADTAWH
jgi:hypothetical protein